MTEKRNWADVTDFLHAKLQQEDQVVKRIRLDNDTHQAYSKLKNKESTLRTKHFVERVFNTSTHGSFDYSVGDNVLNKKHKGSYNIPITVRDFKLGCVGHGLCYDFKSSYVAPLMLDLDCLKCKQQVCTEPISIEVVNGLLFENITDSISSLMNIPIEEVKKKTVIFKKSNQCNLHIYTSFSVSIILYDLMRIYIETRFPSLFMDRYCVDNVTALDFPYSSKNETDVYHPTDEREFKLDIVVNPTFPFYEVPLQTTVQHQYVNSVILGNFDTVNQNTDWYDENINLIYLTTPAKLEVFTTSKINSYIKNIKISQVKFTTERKILYEYFNGSTKQETGFLDVTIFEKLGSTEYEKSVQHTLLSLSNKIAKLVFKEKVISEYRKLSYLLNFIMIDDCGYAFYIIMAVIAYVLNTNNYCNNVNINCYKLTTLDILHTMSEFSEQPALTRIINQLKNFDIYIKLEVIFKEPIIWFMEIAKQLESKEFESNISFLLSQVTVYDDLKSLERVLLKLCTLEMPMIRNGTDSGLYYYYSRGQYLEIKETTLLSVSQSIKTKMLHNNMVNFCKQLEEEHQISKELLDTCNEKFFKDVWFKYLTQIPIRKPLFNLYDYFISTELGVFNTITGLYMNHTQLLYMSGQKSYCTTPINAKFEHLNLSVINKYIADEYGRNEELLEELIRQQTKLFYIAVMIPGLLTLQDVTCSQQDSNEIMKKISNTIIYDEDIDNNNQLYYILPVIIHYRLIVSKLLHLVKHMPLMTVFSVENLYETVLNNEETEYDDSEPEIEYDKLIQTLVVDPKYNIKSLVIVIMWVIMDQCNDELLDRLFETPISNKTLPVLEMYKDCDASSNFKLEPFCLHDYSSNSNINFKRALRIAIPHHTFNESFINLFSSLSQTFNFNRYVLDDFLHFAAMIYYPGSERKRILLMIGSQSCGKTTIQDAFYSMQRHATFSIDSVVQGNSGPAPELIKVYNSYLFNIVELKTISPEIMKTLTGGDLQFKRQLYQNEYKEMKPLAFTIAASNAIPVIPGADEAIKVRLAPFMMNSKYDRLDKYEDNTLILNVKNILIKSPTFSIETFAVELSNVLYHQFCNKRDEFGLITPRVHEKNLPSNKMITECLSRNNYIYNLLDRSNIVFNSTLSITDEELKIAMEDAIAEYNNATQKKKLTFSFIKKNMDTLFVNYMNVSQDGYNGFGLAKPTISNNQVFELVADPNCKCKVVKIKSYLLTNNYATHVIEEKIKELIQKYADAYDAIGKVFKGYKLVKRI